MARKNDALTDSARWAEKTYKENVEPKLKKKQKTKKTTTKPVKKTTSPISAKTAEARASSTRVQKASSSTQKGKIKPAPKRTTINSPNLSDVHDIQTGYQQTNPSGNSGKTFYRNTIKEIQDNQKKQADAQTFAQVFGTSSGEASGTSGTEAKAGTKAGLLTTDNRTSATEADVTRMLNTMLANGTAWAKSNKRNQTEDSSLHQINLGLMENINERIRSEYRKAYGEGEYNWDTYEPVTYDPHTGDYTLNYTGAAQYDPNTGTWSYTGGKTLSHTTTTHNGSPALVNRQQGEGLNQENALRVAKDEIPNRENMKQFLMTDPSTLYKAELETAYEKQTGKTWEESSGFEKNAYKAKAAVDQGLYAANQGIMQAVDWVLPTETVFGENNAFDRWLDDWYGNDSKTAQQFSNQYRYAMEQSNAAGMMGMDVTNLVVQQIPLMVAAAATGGMSEGAALANAGKDGGAALLSTMQNIAKSPSFWTSFGIIAGPSYYSAKESGASELDAQAYAISTAFLQSLIEQGGGLETLNQEGAAKSLNDVVKKTLKTMWEEGGEEVQQDMVDQFMQLGYTTDKPLYSADDENAWINPRRMGANFLGGAVAGGLMGGTSHALNYAGAQAAAQQSSATDTGTGSNPQTDSGAAVGTEKTDPVANTPAGQNTKPEPGITQETGQETPQKAVQQPQTTAEETISRVKKNAAQAVSEAASATSKKVTDAASSDAAGATANTAQAHMGDAGAEAYVKTQMQDADTVRQQAFANTYAAALELGADSSVVDDMAKNLSAEQKQAAVTAAQTDRASMHSQTWQTAMQSELGSEGRTAYEAGVSSASDVEGYTEAFLRYYTAGLEGTGTEIQSSYANAVSSDVISAAYQAGLADAKATMDMTETAIREGRINVYRDGGLVYDTNTEGLDETTRQTLDQFGRDTGMAVRVVPTIDGGTKNGVVIGNTMILARDAEGSTVDRALRRAATHEVTHRIQTFAPKEYSRFRNAAVEARVRAELSAYNADSKEQMKLADMKEAVITQVMEDYAKAGVTLTREQALDEIAADYASDLMTNPKAIQQFIETRPQTAKTFWQKLRNAIRSLKKKITGKTAAERRFLRELGTAEKLWLDAYATASDGAKTVLKSDSVLPAVGKGLVRNDAGDIVAFKSDTSGAVFNIATYNKGGRNALKSYLVQQVDRGNLSQEDADSIITNMERMYRIARRYANKPELYPSFSVWSDTMVRFGEDGKPYMTVVKQNNEYAMNIDVSTVCKKRKNLDRILARLSLDDTLETIKDDGVAITKINDIIRKHGLEVACGLCYVDAKRYEIFEWAKSFTDGVHDRKPKDNHYGWNDLVRSMIPAGSNQNATYFTIGSDRNGGDNMIDLRTADNLDYTLVDRILQEQKPKKGSGTEEYRMAQLLKDDPASRQQLYYGDITHAAGTDALKGMYRPLYDIMYSHYGAGKPKTPSAETPYVNEITYREGSLLQVSDTFGEQPVITANIDVRSRAGFLRVGKRVEDVNTVPSRGTENATFNVEKAYAVGGVRLQSFSDYVPNMFLDYCQIVADLSAKKLPAHMYTKEITCAKLFGQTGIKINLSLVPDVMPVSSALREKWNSLGKGNLESDPDYRRMKARAGLDDRGNYLWSAESIDFHDAVALIRNPKYSRNVGTIAVGISDAHIEKLLADDRISMVIPYHKSGLPVDVQQRYNIDLYTDYTLQQNTKVILPDGGTAGFDTAKKKGIVRTDFNFYESLLRTNDPKTTVQEYFDYCDANRLQPKFSQFRDNPNYYKLLADFRLYDLDGSYAPQEAVQMKYPRNTNSIVRNSLRAYQTDALDRYAAAEDQIEAEVRAVLANGKRSATETGKKYSVKKKAAEDGGIYDYTKSFAQQIKDWKAGKIPKRDSLLIGGTPEVFQKIGFNALPMTINQAHVDYAINGTKNEDHTIGEDGLRQLPEALQHPVAVIASETKRGTSVVVLLPFTHNGNTVIAPVVIDGFARQNNILLDSNAVTSVHGRKNAVTGLLETALNRYANGETTLFYWDKEKATALLQKARVTMPKSSAQARNGYVASIRDANSPVKPKLENVTQSVQFKHWFGDWQKHTRDVSKIVNPDGTPKVVYYDAANSGSGVYRLTDNAAGGEAAYLNIRNPYRVSQQPNPQAEGQLIRHAQQKGYDGIVMEGSTNRYLAFRQEQIKSANDNIGIFDKTNPDIRRSVKGAGQNTADRIHQNQPETDEAVEEYGAIEPGENPATIVTFPQSKDGRTRTRRFMRTAAEANQASDEQISDLERAVMEDAAASYVPEGNAENLRRAQNTIDVQGLDTASAQWEAVVNGEKPPSARDVALGSALLDRAMREGRVQDATRLTEQLAYIGTRAGQAVQAMRMLKKLGGVSQLRYADMAVRDLQRQLLNRFGDRAPKLEIPSDLQQKLLKAGTEPEREAIMQDIFQHVADQLPVTLSDRWNAWRYFAMLANPRTHVRNMIGNAVFMPAITIKNVQGAIIESVASRTVAKGMDRTKSVRALLPSETHKLARRIARDTYVSAADEINGGGKYNPADQIRDKQKLFRSRPGKVLQWAMDKNGDLLDQEDRLFQRIQYSNALTSYIVANGYTEQQLMRDGKPTAALNQAMQYAIREAQRATYHDASAFASGLQQLSRSGKVANLLVEGLMPFKKTPVNILKRAVEYSPAGLVHTLAAQTGKAVRGQITPAEYIDNLTKGLTGTQVVLLGAYMAAHGILYASGGDDRDKANYEQYALGEQIYSIRWGDHSYTIDWAAPMVMPLMVGAELMHALERDSGYGFADVANSLVLVSEPLISLSMMDGLQSAFENISSSDGNMLTNFGISVLGSYFSQAVPTLLGQAARIGQENSKMTYTNPDSWIPVFAQKILYKSRNKVPAVPQALLEQFADTRAGNLLQWYNDHCTIAAGADLVNDWGRIQSSGSLPWRMFSNLLSPGYYSRIQISSTDTELLRLYDQYGEDAGILPKYMSKRMSVDAADGSQSTVSLSKDEWTQYKVEYGTRAYDLLTKMMQTQAYREAADDQKVEYLKAVYDYALGTAAAAVRKDAHITEWVSELAASGMDPVQGITVRAALKDIMDSFDDDATTQETQRARFDYINSLDISSSQKETLSRLFISDHTVPDYSNAESLAISQMSDSAQRHWPQAKAAGYSYDQYTELYRIISKRQDGYQKDDRRKDAIDAGYTAAQFTQMWDILKKSS